MADALSVWSAPALSVASGRYTVYGEIASGGMATVQYGRLVGPGGFARGVAIKRLHAQFARDPSFVSMFLDEARLAARIAHANVVPTIDVLSGRDEVSVVMEYVHGESLAGLLAMASARGAAVPVRIATTLLTGVLHGLHAAHETRGEQGEPLDIVHRDVSPQNILVGSDGVARLLDFGIAKTQVRSRATPTGELKGKLAYMAFEQYLGEEVDRRADIYGASVVLWEALTGRSLFDGPSDAAIASAVMNRPVPAPSELAPGVPEALDRIVLRGLSRDRDVRFPTAREMALALEREVGVAPQSEVSDWVHAIAGELLAARADALRQMQSRVEAHLPREPVEVSTRRIEAGAEPSSWLRPVTRPHAGAAIDDAASRSFEGDPLAAARARRSRRIGLGMVLIVLAAAGVWTVSAANGTGASVRRDDRSPAAPVQAAADPAQRVAPEPIAAPRVDELPAAAPAVVPVAAVAAPADAAPAAPSSRSQPERSAPRKERASRGKTRKGVDCSQPFVIDAMGIRRVKRECL
jgi:serine/threonine-protein kinase